uniref:Uncharacterized protein n=1 Tax=Globodera rostochiensis TaxID=31243 RepID=A0A914HRC8_GLORO
MASDVSVTPELCLNEKEDWGFATAGDERWNKRLEEAGTQRYFLKKLTWSKTKKMDLLVTDHCFCGTEVGGFSPCLQNGVVVSGEPLVNTSMLGEDVVIKGELYLSVLKNGMLSLLLSTFLSKIKLDRLHVLLDRLFSMLEGKGIKLQQTLKLLEFVRKCDEMLNWIRDKDLPFPKANIKRSHFDQNEKMARQKR